MASMDFPDSPAVNDEFTVGQRTWVWTGVSWDAKSTIPTALSEMSDVAITSATTGQILRYNGTIWINSSVLDGGSA
jgi:hypothetical protein